MGEIIWIQLSQTLDLTSSRDIQKAYDVMDGVDSTIGIYNQDSQILHHLAMLSLE